MAFKTLPRMLVWCVLSLVLVVAALVFQNDHPGSVFAVTLYKAHLMALGGWGGYWLDRALFPYARPHADWGPPGAPATPAAAGGPLLLDEESMLVSEPFISDSAVAMIRRAIVVAACLVCVGLGA